ncbi:MAG TPA: hypothetical protein VHD34_11260 [Xanthobacteraceae bacterium]|nr:hypothetical protein [Xanthobacteraceae bacterium]
MPNSNSLVSASLSIALAAGAAAVFTIATDSSAADPARAAQPAKASFAERSDLRSLYFDARPIAGSHKLLKQQVPLPARGAVSEEIVPEQTNDKPQNREIMNGCESGLSPDISPTFPIRPGRCLT